MTILLEEPVIYGTAASSGAPTASCGPRERPEPRTAKRRWFIGYTPDLATGVWVGMRPAPADPG
jgi:membrane peptidoglycan carboxypeptidase